MSTQTVTGTGTMSAADTLDRVVFPTVPWPDRSGLYVNGTELGNISPSQWAELLANGTIPATVGWPYGSQQAFPLAFEAWGADGWSLTATVDPGTIPADAAFPYEFPITGTLTTADTGSGAGTPSTGTDLLSLDEVRAFVNVPARALADEDLERMLEAAIGVVVESCRVPRDDVGAPTSTGWPPALVDAVLRRVQRSIAVKGLPLGYTDMASEYGPAKIPAYDVQIEELEGRYRRAVFG